jgi:hypothetical protein
MSRRKLKLKDDSLELDQIFVGHDRLLVSTYWVGLRSGEEIYQTLAVGPGAREGDYESGHRYYTSEAAARTGHEAVLASYGYRKTGLRKWKIFRLLEYMGRGIVNVSRRPPSRKSAWIMTSFWAIAFFFAAGATIFSGWPNLITAALDGYMLYNCIQGLRWLRSQRSDTVGV